MAAKLFLGGISPNTSKEDIEAHFGQFGTITDAVVMYKDGKHRGFGFVTFDNTESMNAVLQQEQVIDGRAIDVKPAVPGDQKGGKGMAPCGGGGAYASGGGCAGGGGGRQGQGYHKVFIGGLAAETTDDMVNEYFSRFGTLTDLVVMKDRATGKPRGFGFIQFDNPDSVEQVMAQYSDHQLAGKWIEVKRAVKQDQMGYGGGGCKGGGKGGGYGGGKGGCGGGYGPGPGAYGGCPGGGYGGGYAPAYQQYPPAPAYGGGYGAPPPAYGGGYGIPAYQPGGKGTYNRKGPYM